MTDAVLIVAAGRGQRLGGEAPKQYLPLAGPCALRRSVDLFRGLEGIGPILTVIHPDDRPLYDEAMSGLSNPRVLAPVAGGETRAASVRNGLEALAAAAPERVLIHDAARPFVTAKIVRAVLAALDTADGAFAALPVVDALWSAADGMALSPVAREGLWRAQTPQGFRFEAILAAHRAASGDAADDVAVARAAGLSVRVVEGSERNFKITTPADLARAIAEIGGDQGRPPSR